MCFIIVNCYKHSIDITYVFQVTYFFRAHTFIYLYRIPLIHGVYIPRPPVCMPETTESTEPCVNYVFTFTYMPLLGWVFIQAQCFLSVGACFLFVFSTHKFNALFVLIKHLSCTVALIFHVIRTNMSFPLHNFTGRRFVLITNFDNLCI